jgi:triose/dihydroxyacetone kinase / FAD-AMP lyase (cyclizing)
VGRRGLAGTILVEKILGALSRDGKSLGELVKIGRLVAENMVTLGVSLGHVHIPGTEVSNGAALNHDQLELGMGIHNEPGCEILSPRPDLQSLLNMMLDQLLDMTDKDRAYVDFKDAEHVVLLVNNFGGVSVLELSGITKHVVEKLGTYSTKAGRKIVVDDIYRSSKHSRLKNVLGNIYDELRFSRLQRHSPQGNL